MTKTDKAIIVTFGIFIFGLAITHYSISLKVIAIAVAALYSAFIAFHLALCIPLIAVVMGTLSLIDNSKLSAKIKRFSYIIYGLICVIGVATAIISIYVGIPYVAAMLWNNSIDIHEATKFLRSF
jgi:hypothetical protein